MTTKIVAKLYQIVPFLLLYTTVNYYFYPHTKKIKVRVLKKYFFIIAVMLTAPLHGSQKSLVKYAHGQKNLYTYDDIRTTIQNSMHNSIDAFNNGEYQTASALATGALQYINVMEEFSSHMHLEPSQDSSEQLNFIIAKSNIETESPQRALSAFKAICDKQTSMGTISSADIAECMHNKIRCLPDKHTLIQKLQTQATFFEQKASQFRIDFYTSIYKDFSLEDLISAIKTVDTIEQGQALVRRITHYADQNNMRALCYLVNIYDKGLCHCTVDKQKALSYAYQYVVLFAKNSKDLPFEHFGIKLILQDASPSENISCYVANIYFDYLQAMKNDKKDTAQKALIRLNTINDEAKPLRDIIVAICTAIIEQKEIRVFPIICTQLTHKNCNPRIHSFIKTDGNIVKHLLEPLSKSKDVGCFLGILSYYMHDYIGAKNYFCNNSKRSDLVTQWYSLLSNYRIDEQSVLKHIEALIIFMQNINHLQKKQSAETCTTAASLARKYIIDHCAAHISFLLNNHHYNAAQNYSQLLLNDQQMMPQCIRILPNIIELHKDKQMAESLLFQKYLTPMTTHFCKCIEKKSNTCALYTDFVALFLSYKTNHNKEHLLKQIAVCLKKIENDKGYVSSHQKHMGSVYYVLGKEYGLIMYFDKAIAVGHENAAYEKALLLLQQARVQKNETMALELLKKHAQGSSSLRFLSLYKLGELYFNYAVQDNLLRHTKPDSTLSFNYLQQAAGAGDENAYGLLAVHYIKGQKNNNDSWLREPDAKKAEEYFNQCKFVPTPCEQEILFHRAIMQVTNDDKIAALDDFNRLHVPSLPKDAQKDVVFHKTFLPLRIVVEQAQKGLQHDGNFILNTLIHVYKAYTENKHPLHFVDDDVTQYLIKNTTLIMNKLQNDECYCALCIMTGTLLNDAIITSTVNSHESMQHGARCLCYAADHGDIHAQINAAGMNPPYISRPQAIAYLLQAHIQEKKQNYDQTIKKMLLNALPVNIKEQHEVLTHYIDNNNTAMAHLYLEKLYSVQPVTILKVSKKEREALLHSCRNNTFLQELADNVLTKPPHETNKTEQAAALLRASIYILSKNEDELLENIKVINALPESFKKAYKKILLGLTYYELSRIYAEQNNDLLHKKYLQKSAECSCPLALKKVKKK